MINKFKVPYIDLPKQYKFYEDDLKEIFHNTAKSGQFILREEVSKLEKKISEFLNVKYAVGVNSGTDALFLSLIANGIKKGDEVITVSHTFIATISTIVHTGASPVLVDIQDDGNINPSLIKQAITDKTKAIVIVHMNGRVCDMDEILNIINEHNLLLIEDAAQSFGASYKNKFAGNFGICGAFSFHPMKVFGCMGDGGLITTNDEYIYNKLLLLRNHGQKTKSDLVLYGYNSRLDNLQAAFLLYRLDVLENELNKRINVAKTYINKLSKITEIKLPSFDTQNRRDIFSSFVIQAEKRDELQKYLLDKSIEVAVHWNTPNHKQKRLDLDHFTLNKTEEYSKNILSLPIHPFLTIEQIDFVIEKIIEFYEKS
ncbi:DegT/DnrJ/EryC1/StrS family aminotransferase [Sulfurimonas lithotrophica]|uniref:DegT/DnrJ/EryC1/StrS family aminotransferase n=1 Tax=Sulfurimonas lithotrophica TaxID=2590022 RepID=A0A5P8NY41_9BACT|nr:DegT/DnrJ/EryC1/StrS family aminotransferase [Sulfurimonas lithotrophica]QFR48355.1 DegT/DnrJ/EryC1/StrS family aminotransferase [Sulfurimonas lithotrophica]